MKRISDGFPGARHVDIPENVFLKANQLPVCKDLFPTSVGYYKFAEGHYINREQGSKHHILIGCVSGSGTIRIAGVQYNINSNELVFLPANTPHRYEANPSMPWTILWFHYDGLKCAAYHDALGISADDPIIHVSNIGAIITAFEAIFFHTQNGYTNRALFCLSTSLSHFFGQCCLFKRAKNAPKRMTEEKILESVEFMKSNLGRALVLNDLADVAGFTPPYFSQTFKRQMGASPINFLTSLRLQSACTQLKLTTSSISSIAMTVGFPDPYYFSKVFKKSFKISPSSYRKKFQQGIQSQGI